MVCFSHGCSCSHLKALHIYFKQYRNKHDRLYVMGNFFSYSILQKRAEAVGVIQGSRKCEQLLFKYVMFAVKLGTASMPLLAIACMVLFTGKTYFIE
jgi:hypothetical protein